jgi:hypothetical protein
MTVNLQNDKLNCPVYNDWHQYLQSDEPSAVLDLTPFADMTVYLHRGLNATARNRYNYSYKNGYESRMLTWEERTQYLHNIHAINTSAKARQGKPMSAGYHAFPRAFTTAQNECAAHLARFIGCFKDGICVAYISAHFCGKLAAASQILGHAEHLKNGIMLSVWMEFVAHCFERGIEKIVYSRWKDGTDGLKYWKHSVGMKEEILKEEI